MPVECSDTRGERVWLALLAGSVLLAACAQQTRADLNDEPKPELISAGPAQTQSPYRACKRDDDCTGVGARCEPDKHVCLMRCPSLIIESAQDLTQARYCYEVDGDVRFRSSELQAIGPDDLPYLEKITGNVFSIGGQPIREIVLSALREIGSDAGDSLVEISLDQSHLRRVAFPELRAVHGTVSLFGLYALEELEFPALESVDRVFSLINLPRLTSLVLPAELQSSEPSDFEYLCALPADAISVPADASKLKAVGCCTASAYECDTLQCRCE